MAGGISTVPKMYEHIESIQTRIDNRRDNDALSLMDRAAIAWIDRPLVQNFLQHPEDKVIRDELSTELLLIRSSLGPMPDIEPYTPEELDRVDAGAGATDELVQSVILANTFRYAVVAPRGHIYAPFCMRQLAFGIPPNNIEAFDWQSGFLFALLLRTTWMLFRILAVEHQTLLLQKYFFVSVAAGAPLRFIFRDFVESGAVGEKDQRLQRIIFALEQSQEIVPFTIQTGEGKVFALVYKNYLARTKEKALDGFTQEQFISDIYGTQAGRDSYIRWLREALNIVLHLKKGDV